MGSAVATLYHTHQKNRIIRKKTNELSTPLSIAVSNQQWSLVSGLIDADPTALYQPNIYRKLPLQTSIKLKCPIKVLMKLVRRCARIQVPRPLPEETEAPLLEDIIANPPAIDGTAEATDPLIPPPPLLPSPNSDPIQFHQNGHVIGLLQLLLCTVKSEAKMLKLILIVIDERTKNEKLAVS